MIFDQSVKLKSPVLQSQFNSGDWEHFLDKLYNANAAEEHTFDKTIRAKLNDGPQSGVQADSFFERHSNSLNRNIRRIRLLKTAEVAAIFLILFLAWNILPEWENTHSTQVTVTNPTHSNLTTVTKESRVAVAGNVPGMNEIVNKAEGSNHTQIKQTVSVSNVALNPVLAIKEEKQMLPRLNLQSVSSSESVMQPGQDHIESVIDDNSSFANQGAELKQQLPKIAGTNAKIQTDRNLLLPVLTYLPKSTAQLSISPDLNQVIALSKPKNSGVIDNIFLGVQAGAVIDQVSTPISNLSGKNTYSKGIFNNLAGLFLEIENRWVNVETGIVYSFKKYGLENPDNSKGHFINIPVSLKKVLFPGKKVEPYLKIGPDFNIVMAASTKPERLYGEFLALDNYAPSINYISKSNRSGGVLKAGDLQDNSYLGIHAAIGAETTLGKGGCLTLEVSKQFNPFQKGLGINNQKFTQTAITLGIKKMIYHDVY